MVDVTFWLMTLFAAIGIVTSLVLHRRSEDLREKATQQQARIADLETRKDELRNLLDERGEEVSDLESYVSELKTYQYAVVDIIEDLHGKETNVLKQETVDKIMETEEGQMLAAGEEIVSVNNDSTDALIVGE